MTPDDKLFDDVVTQALNILRLGASKRSATMRKLERMAKEIVASMGADELAKRPRKELEAFLTNAEAIIAKQYGLIQESLELAGIAEVVSDQTANSLQLALGINAVGLPKSSYFRSVESNVLIEGSPLRDWWKGQELDTQRRFTGAVRQGLLNNETNQQIIRRIVGTNEEPGAMDLTRRNAASLVQTSVQAVANDARRETFDANADVIKGIRQVSTLDSHTSRVCMAYSGASWNLKREPLNGSPPFNGGCPRHFNCRSVEVPITKTFRELGLDIDEVAPTTRASDQGQIAAGTTFDEYLRRKGKAFQDEMLGEGRADLWRDKKITLRDLVNGDGRELTLNELRDYASMSFSPVTFAAKFDDADVTARKIIDGFPANTSALIRKTEAELAELGETKKVYHNGKSYSPERLELHRRILYDGVYGFDPDNPSTPKFYPGLLAKEATDKAKPDAGQDPTFTILGGRGGSGKSSFDGQKFPEAKVYDKDRVLLFDADHIKHMLPEYRGSNAFQVHEESSDLLKQVLDLARKGRLNVVLDGTLKSYDGAKATVDGFARSGFRVEGHYMHLPRQEAAKRAVGRYLTSKGDGSGRYVPVQIILDNDSNEENFMRLLEFFDGWSFRDNNVERGQPPRLIAQRKARR